MTNPETALQILSTVKSDGTLELTLGELKLPELGPDHVLIRVEAAPLNPTDLGLMFGLADMTTAKAGGTAARPLVTASVAPALLKSLAARFDQALPVGSEGSGVVIKAGSSPQAQALIGRVVALVGGGMYAQYRRASVDQCLVLPEGTKPAECASCFVNPLTALGMVETMRMEGHSALVHTAAASNLGQMLNKICLGDGIELVNIVRKPEQAELLKRLGAKHVVSSSAPSFLEDLTEALATTSATLAFDAVGGGELTSQILSCMELAQSRKATAYNRYGSSVHKQAYIYGVLDRSPTVLKRAYGFAWGIGGWVLPNFLAKLKPEDAARLRARVANEIKTTFASQYSRTVSLPEVLSLEAIAAYGKLATGEKYLVAPHKA